MLNMIHADLYKMYKSSAIKILFGISAICALIMTIMAYMIPLGKIDIGNSGIGFLFSDINVTSILGAAMTGIFICSDFENKSIHQAITGGCGRGTTIVGKAISFFCAIAFITIPYAVAVGIGLGTGNKYSMGSLGLGFLNLLTQGDGKALEAGEILKLLVVMLTLVIVYIAQLSLCVPLAVSIKKPVAVVALYYGFTILTPQLQRLAENSPMLKDITLLTPFGLENTLLNIGSGIDNIVKAFTVSIIFIALMLSITYWLFRKVEVK